MLELTEKLIIALDVGTLQEAQKFVEELYPEVKMFKVGSQLFTACGHDAIRMIYKKGAKVFLDLKFFDIPNTVFSAVISGTGLAYTLTSTPVSTSKSNMQSAGKIDIKEVIEPAVFMMTVHISGGEEMLKAAADGAAKRAKELKITKPFIVGVTRLTSEEETSNTIDEVLSAAKLAKDSGLDGVVCSANEAAKVRETFGKDFLIVTPGIRPKNSKKDDQSRVASAQEALRAGSNYLVVGRPILQAPDPLQAVKDLLKGL